MTAEPFPVLRMAAASSSLAAPRWLIEPLWAAAGAGVLGAQPKAGKTFLALDMAVSVASGTPCLDTFRVGDPGPVLLFLAEDSAQSAYERVSSICHHRNLDLPSLDLFLLTTPVLRLDLPSDAARLAATVATVRPRLLVLDPFVRVQAIEENSASEVSRLLADLTVLKRAFDLAILLVHHVRKNGSGHPGQTLRGSGDLRAWGDSNLYLKPHGDRLELSGEHRAAPAIAPVSLKLVTNRDGSCPRLAVLGEPQPQGPPPTLLSRLRDTLERSRVPLTRTALRQLLEVNNQRLGDALTHLERSGHILRGADGWRSSTPFRSLPLGEGRNGTLTDSTPALHAAPATA